MIGAKAERRRLIDISLSVSPVHDENGVFVGASKIARDYHSPAAKPAELEKLAAIVDSSATRS